MVHKHHIPTVCVDSVVRLCKERMRRETHQEKHKELARLLQGGEPANIEDAFWVGGSVCVCVCESGCVFSLVCACVLHTCTCT
jgi:hypothetical protein